VNYRTAW